MSLAFLLALGVVAATPDAVPQQIAPAAAATPAVQAGGALTPPPGAAKTKPALVCHSRAEVGSLLPVKVCSRPGDRNADDMSKLELLQQRSFFKPRE